MPLAANMIDVRLSNSSDLAVAVSLQKTAQRAMAKPRTMTTAPGTGRSEYSIPPAASNTSPATVRQILILRPAQFTRAVLHELGDVHIIALRRHEGGNGSPTPTARADRPVPKTPRQPPSRSPGPRRSSASLGLSQCRQSPSVPTLDPHERTVADLTNPDLQPWCAFASVALSIVAGLARERWRT